MGEEGQRGVLTSAPHRKRSAKGWGGQMGMLGSVNGTGEKAKAAQG